MTHGPSTYAQTIVSDFQVSLGTPGKSLEFGCYLCTYTRRWEEGERIDQKEQAD